MKHQFETIEYPNGTHSLRDLTLGEIMHSSIGPDQESALLYAEQSRVAERLRHGGEPLVLFDVGMGTAANAIAAMESQRLLKSGAGPKARPLHIHSFEKHPEGLEAALADLERFTFLKPYADAARELLARGHWDSPDGAIQWTLHTGPFEEQIHRLPALPEVVFYDFYAPKTCPGLWSLELFEKFAETLRPPRDAGRPTTLYTYTASTRVRVALLLCGFFVGHGRSTSAKLETTIASTHLSEITQPLGEKWIGRFTRSGDRAPYRSALDTAPIADLERKVLSSRQFLPL